MARFMKMNSKEASAQEKNMQKKQIEEGCNAPPTDLTRSIASKHSTIQANSAVMQGNCSMKNNLRCAGDSNMETAAVIIIIIIIEGVKKSYHYASCRRLFGKGVEIKL